MAIEYIQKDDFCYLEKYILALIFQTTITNTQNFIRNKCIKEVGPR